MGDLSRDKLQSAPRRFMVEQNPAYRIQAIGLPIVHCDPVAIHFGHAVRRTRIEGRRLALGGLICFPEHLRGAGLVELRLRMSESDGFEDAGYPQGRKLTGQHWLTPTGRNKALRRQIVDLVRLNVTDHRCQGVLIQQISR